MSEAKSAKPKRWKRDYEIEEASGGVFKASTLRKDRVGAQRFPFHRINDSVYYDLEELNATVEAARFGGKIEKPAGKASRKVAA